MCGVITSSFAFVKEGWLALGGASCGRCWGKKGIRQRQRRAACSRRHPFRPDSPGPWELPCSPEALRPLRSVFAGPYFRSIKIHAVSAATMPQLTARLPRGAFAPASAFQSSGAGFLSGGRPLFGGTPVGKRFPIHYGYCTVLPLPCQAGKAGGFPDIPSLALGKAPYSGGRSSPLGKNLPKRAPGY